MKKIVACITSFIFIFALTPKANAVYNGSLAVGDVRVVSLIKDKYSNRPFCSGSLINEQVVVSAAHCLGNDGIKYTNEIFDPQDLWVSFPGSDLNLDDKNKRVKIIKVFLTNGYTNDKVLTQKDDIAFYLLEKPIIDSYKINIATESDIEFIKKNRLLITHIGYGIQSMNQFDGKPYLITLSSFLNGANRYYNNPALEINTLASEETGDKALCPGDSGSPWYATIDGVQKLVAVTIGGSGCRGEESGSNGTFGTAIYPYLYLIANNLQTDKKNEPEIVTTPKAVEPKTFKCIKKIKGKNIKCYNRPMDGTLEPSK